MTRLKLLLAATLIPAATATGQNNGLPNRQQSAVLMTLIADRGEACDLLRPWQAASLRMQTRDLIAQFDDSVRTVIEHEVEQQRATMACDNNLLVQWTAAAAPNMEREYLPEMLTAFKAMAELDPHLAGGGLFANSGEVIQVIRAIDQKLAAMVKEGVRLPGDMTLDSLQRRQGTFARQIQAAFNGTGDPGRFDRIQASHLIVDVARITRLWWLEQ